MRMVHFFSYRKYLTGVLLGIVCVIVNPGMKRNIGLYADEMIAETSLGLRRKTVIREIDYQCETEYVKVNFLYQDEKKVVQTAKTGMKALTERILYQNGEEKNRERIAEKIVEEARPKVIAMGTKKRPEYIRPVEGGVTSSYFGPRWGEFHLGHDWAIPLGSDVMAAKDGTVKEARWNNSYGYYVLIDHGDGYETRYAHLSEMLVEMGQAVKQGEVIAHSGSTGNSTGPHLHFEVLRNGRQVEPLDFVKE